MACRMRVPSCSLNRHGWPIAGLRWALRRAAGGLSASYRDRMGQPARCGVSCRPGSGGGGRISVRRSAYASPEQIAGGRLDERSDLYSLGAVLYELVTGQRPQRDGRAAIIPSVLAGHGAPPALDAIIGRLLAERPDDRPASADEVLAGAAG
jgi:hypothetical protein